MPSVALFAHEACLAHDAGPDHPESPARLRTVIAVLEGAEFLPLKRMQAPRASEDAVLLVHSSAYLSKLKTLTAGGQRIQMDADTVLMPRSLEAALRAAGGATQAVDLVLSGCVERAFVAARPPGHHAEREQAMGFCFLSTAAIAARHARLRGGVRRAAVIDFDVHHGNGTQAALAAFPELLYISSHQMPCYPGTGDSSDVGSGNVLNLPLAPGTGSTRFREVWQRQGLPRLAAFAPELVIISAGFDAHHQDPLAQISLQAEDFRWLTQQLVAVAQTCCAGRIVSLLEGGYHLEALAKSTKLHVDALMHG